MIQPGSSGVCYCVTLVTPKQLHTSVRGWLHCKTKRIIDLDTGFTFFRPGCSWLIIFYSRHLAKASSAFHQVI